MIENPDGWIEQFREAAAKSSTVAELDQLQMQVRRNCAILLASYTEVDLQYAKGNSRQAMNILLGSVLGVATLQGSEKDHLIAHLGLLLYAELRHKHGGVQALQALFDGVNLQDSTTEQVGGIFAPQPEWPTLND